MAPSRATLRPPSGSAVPKGPGHTAGIVPSHRPDTRGMLPIAPRAERPQHGRAHGHTPGLPAPVRAAFPLPEAVPPRERPIRVPRELPVRLTALPAAPGAAPGGRGRSSPAAGGLCGAGRAPPSCFRSGSRSAAGPRYRGAAAGGGRPRQRGSGGRRDIAVPSRRRVFSPQGARLALRRSAGLEVPGAAGEAVPAAAGREARTEAVGAGAGSAAGALGAPRPPVQYPKHCRGSPASLVKPTERNQPAFLHFQEGSQTALFLHLAIHS